MMPNAAAFFSFIFLTAFTPGPNNIMAMTNAGKNGFRGGMPFCFGVFWGVIGVMSACAVFCTLLFTLIPKIEPGMRFLGAAYILLLAWSVFRDRPAREKKPFLRPDSLFTGMVMQFVNVKVILYGITAFSTFILPYYKNAPAIAVFVLVLTLTGFAGTCSWALFGSLFQRLFTTRKRAVNAVMAALLVYCAVTLVL